jgi:hypothetical protein
VQQRQSSQSPLDNLAIDERLALRRVRTQRLQFLVTGAGAALLALFAVGCPTPADLENADAYPAPANNAGTATGGGGSGGGGGMATCETACMDNVLAGCVLCHSSAAMLGKLILDGDNYTARLKDQPAKHDAPGAGAVCPTGDKLIDSANPSESWLLKKVKNEQGNCGTVMPQGGPLSGADLMCVQDYVTCVANGAPSGGGGAASGGGGNGGTGGT